MRSLWPIEQEVFEITAREYPASTDFDSRSTTSGRTLRKQRSWVLLLLESSDRDPASEGKVAVGRSLWEWAGCRTWYGLHRLLENGRLSLIEGYCNGNVSTVGFDFEKVTFDLKSWGSKNQM